MEEEYACLSVPSAAGILFKLLQNAFLADVMWFSVKHSDFHNSAFDCGQSAIDLGQVSTGQRVSNKAQYWLGSLSHSVRDVP